MTSRNRHTITVGPASVAGVLKSLAAVLAFGAITATGAAAFRLLPGEHHRSLLMQTRTSRSLRLKLHAITNVVVHNGVAAAITPSTAFASSRAATRSAERTSAVASRQPRLSSAPLSTTYPADLSRTSVPARPPIPS